MKFWYAVLLFIGVLNFIGCVSVPYVQPPPSGSIPGIYHRVERGQTLWRIAKIYNLDLEKIVEINHIQDASNIEIGQLIFIPERQKPQGQGSISRSDDFIWPVKGKVIAVFGQTCGNMVNKGINIEPYGNLDVVAARSGKVVFYSENFEGFGKTVIIKHEDDLSTIYARNSEIFIKPGDNIQKGMVIARLNPNLAGREGYLHFEIRKGHLPQNPVYYLPQ